RGTARREAQNQRVETKGGRGAPVPTRSQHVHPACLPRRGRSSAFHRLRGSEEDIDVAGFRLPGRELRARLVLHARGALRIRGASASAPGVHPPRARRYLGGMNAPAIPELPPERASARRAAICRALGDDVMVLAAAPVRYAWRDTALPYRPDSELFYAAGASEPGSLAVLIGGDAPEWVLFVPPRDPDVELWSGARLGVDAALERFRPAACHPSTEIEERLPALLQRGARIHFRAGSDERVERLVRRALVEARSRGQRTGAGPRGVLDPGGILDELRLRKDPDEVVRIRRAGTLTLVGHRAGAATIAPGAGEWEVQAALEAAFRRGGA